MTRLEPGTPGDETRPDDDVTASAALTREDLRVPVGPGFIAIADILLDGLAIGVE